MLEDEFKQIWQQLEQARKDGTEDDDDKGKDDETLTAEYRPIAERRVRLGLLLAEIALGNAITVTDQELDRAFYSRAMQFQGQEAQMLELYRKYPQFGNTVRGPLMEDKVVDFVLELATVAERLVFRPKNWQKNWTPPPTRSQPELKYTGRSAGWLDFPGCGLIYERLFNSILSQV